MRLIRAEQGVPPFKHPLSFSLVEVFVP